MSIPEPSELVNLDLLEAVSSRLDLRAPNREALLLTAYRLAEHYTVDERTETFEGVCDVATGVGKTYIIAGAIEYFSSVGTRNFAVIAPGTTIQRKTQLQFSGGNSKSLLGGMDVKPVVITSENFNSAEIASALEDDEQVKLFIFTVQSLLKPEKSEAGRRTHKFQEGLGKAFYAHLNAVDDLIVFADEHHTYYGDAFSKAVRGLSPYALVGLTATPHKKTPPEQIYFRYPLSAAIADQLVKAPVVVGRSDDRKDIATKLLDAARLLAMKETALERNEAVLEGRTVNPVMLIVAKTIEDADEVGKILREGSFAGGRFVLEDPEKDPVLVVHSKAKEETLAALDKVEEPDSPVRAIVSVGMLKEGWDVKNVYVIVSLRSSVSEILTEQTLGRGLRLPFGRYTGVELLDTLEVVAHERYEELLKKSGAINQAFIDIRTHIETRRNAIGQEVIVTTQGQVGTEVEESETGSSTTGGVAITTLDGREEAAEKTLETQAELLPRGDLPVLLVPRVTTSQVKASFSLADVVYSEHGNPFRALGERLAVEPDDVLRRTRLGARVEKGPDGLLRTVATTATVADRVRSAGTTVSLVTSRKDMADGILASSVVAPRRGERRALEPILDQFFEGLEAKGGDKAAEILSAYLPRATQRMIELITDEQRRLAATPKIEQVVQAIPFGPVRIGRSEVSDDRAGPWHRGVGYTGYDKSLYEQDWFDSGPEKVVAALLDEAGSVSYWVRLITGDLEIAWDGGNYNPDFISVEDDNTHWIIEVKSDKESKAEDVALKRQAAQRWANHVSAAEAMNGSKWRYLLASEKDIADARGSWPALKGLSVA